MAESSKKNKKKGFKGETLSLGQFQQTNPSPSEASTNWADQVEGFEEDRRDYQHEDRRESGRSEKVWDRQEASSDRFADRPPRRSYDDREPREQREPREPRPIREQNALPDAPPYTAYVGNLPYDTNDEEICQFFSENCNVKNSRIVYDKETGKSKGFSYVEFHDRESLETALQANTVSFKNRALRVDVATAKPSDDRRGRTDQAWVRQERVPEERRDNRSGDRGDYGFRRGGFGDRGGDRDRGGRYGGDRGDRGDRFGGDRGDRFGGDRGDRFGGDRGDRFGGDRGDRFGGDRGDRFGDRGDRFGDRGDRFGDRGDRGGDNERQRLDLKPRSTEEPVGGVATKSRSSPFGDAKPRDETKYPKPDAGDVQAKYEAPQGSPTPPTKPTNPSSAVNDAPWPRGLSPELTKKSDRHQSRQNPPRNQNSKAPKGKTDSNLFNSLDEERT